MLLKRKLFLLPSYIDQMTTSPSPSSLSEFKGSKMGRISSNRKPAGLLQKEFKHFILCKVVEEEGLPYFEVLLLQFHLIDILISEDNRASNLKGDKNPYVILICTQACSFLTIFWVLTLYMDFLRFR